MLGMILFTQCKVLKLSHPLWQGSPGQLRYSPTCRLYNGYIYVVFGTFAPVLRSRSRYFLVGAGAGVKM